MALYIAINVSRDIIVDYCLLVQVPALHGIDQMINILEM